MSHIHSRCDPRYGEFAARWCPPNWLTIAQLAVLLQRTNNYTYDLIRTLRTERPDWPCPVKQRLAKPHPLNPAYTVRREWWLIPKKTAHFLFERELALVWHRTQGKRARSRRIPSPYDHRLLPSDRYFATTRMISSAISSTASTSHGETLRQRLRKATGKSQRSRSGSTTMPPTPRSATLSRRTSTSA